jgi:hypothetical protein
MQMPYDAHVAGELFKILAGVNMVHVPYEVSDWFGLGAPKGTPAAIVDKLNDAVNAGFADSKMKVRITDIGGSACGITY